MESKRYNAAIKARLAYEKNCLWKYDQIGKLSHTPPESESMKAYAIKYGSCVDDMMDYGVNKSVDEILIKDGWDESQKFKQFPNPSARAL